MGFIWYPGFMSIQVSVRLPDDIVHLMDEAVAQGEAPSRAAMVTQALQAALRHRSARKDVEILTRDQEDELEPLVQWTMNNLEASH